MNEKFLFFCIRGGRIFMQNITQNLLSVVAIATITFIFGLLINVGISVNTLVTNLSGTESVRVYLKEIPEDRVALLLDALKKQPPVESATYLDAKASREFILNNVKGVSAMSTLSEDFFPRLISITLKQEYRDDASVQQISAALSKMSGVEAVSSGGKWTEHFRMIRSSLKTFLFLIGGLMALCVGVVIFTTIKLTMFRYRDEIRTYNLVGGTRAFVATPFLFSSMIEALLSGVVAAGFLSLFVFLANKQLLSPVGLDFLAQPGLSTLLFLLLFLLVITLVSGFISVSLFMDKVASINED